MSLRALVESSRTTNLCKMGRLLADLPDDETAALTEARRDLGWGSPRIHAALTSEGYTIAETTVARHLAGGCSCGDAA